MRASRFGWRVGLIAFYAFALGMIRFAQWLRLELDGVPGFASLLVLALILALEGLLTWRFEGPVLLHREGGPGRWRQLVAWLDLLLRVALWLAIFSFAVEYPASRDRTDPDLFARGIGLRLWDFVPTFLSLVPPLSVLAACLWLALVELVVVRRRLLRGVFVMVAPGVLIVGLTFFAYIYGTVDISRDDVVTQPEVDSLFDATALTAEKERSSWRHPRRLIVMPNGRTAVAAFGVTLGGHDPEEPTVWKIDLDTGAYETLRTPSQVWSIGRNPSADTVFAFVWHHSSALEIDLATFEPVAEIGMGDLWPYPSREPSRIRQIGPTLVVAMNALPALLTFDTVRKEFVRKVDFVEAGLLVDGDQCCIMTGAAPDGTLYAMASVRGGSVIIQLDPDSLEILGAHPVAVPGGDIALRPARTPGRGNTIYLSEEYGERIVSIDTSTWEISPLCERDSPWIARLAYDPIADRLLQFDRATGKLTTITPEGVKERTILVGREAIPGPITPEGIEVITTLGIFRVRR